MLAIARGGGVGVGGSCLLGLFDGCICSSRRFVGAVDICASAAGASVRLFVIVCLSLAGIGRSVVGGRFDLHRRVVVSVRRLCLRLRLRFGLIPYCAYEAYQASSARCRSVSGFTLGVLHFLDRAMLVFELHPILQQRLIL